MDVGATNGWRLDDVVPAAEIVERIAAELPLEPVEPDYRGEVAKRWRYRDGGGEIGVIASVTQPFCGDCTRARISAEGRLYTCLFGVRGHDLRALVRGGATDEELRDALVAIWGRRADRYSELRSESDRGDLPQGRDELHRGLERTGRIELSSLVSASPEADPARRTRVLPRGWAHLGLQFGFWFGFYFVYQAARGLADRDGVATAFANGERIIDFQRSLHSMIELTLQQRRRALRLPDPGNLDHVLALGVRRRRAGAHLGLLQAPRSLLLASATRSFSET